MTTDLQRQYQQGYNAGRKHVEKRSHEEERRELWAKTVLAVLPTMSNCQPWSSSDGKKYSDVQGRAGIAVDFADEVLKQFDKRF